MRRSRLPMVLIPLALPILLIGVSSLAVSAQETTVPSPTTEPPTTTEVVTTTIPQPAVSVVDETPPPEQPAWTFAYLVPTALLIGAGTVLITIVMYFVRVTRARYRPRG